MFFSGKQQLNLLYLLFPFGEWMIIASAVKISSTYSQDLPIAALQVSMLPPSMENNFRDPDIKN